MAINNAENMDEMVSADGGIPGLPDWAFVAYKARCYRGQSIAELARRYGVAWKTVKLAVEKVHALVMAVENSDIISEKDKYVCGLKETLACLWKLYAAATHDSAKVGCLKQIAQILQQIAAAEGVVTERRAEEHTCRIEQVHTTTEDQRAEVLEALRELGLVSPVVEEPQ